MPVIKEYYTVLIEGDQRANETDFYDIKWTRIA